MSDKCSSCPGLAPCRRPSEDCVHFMRWKTNRPKTTEPTNAKIIPFGGVTKLDLTPDIVLENLKGKFEGFVIVGYGTDGEEFFSSTYADGGTALWLLERCKRRLMMDEEPK